MATIDRKQIREALEEQRAADEFLQAMHDEHSPAEDGADNLFKPRSNRGVMLDMFTEEVFRHVEEYTIPQYGDFQNDQLTSWTEHDVKTAIRKYVNRLDTNQRGELEATRDLFKIVHYVSVLYCKRMQIEDEFKLMLDEDTAKKNNTTTSEEKAEEVSE